MPVAGDDPPPQIDSDQEHRVGDEDIGDIADDDDSPVADDVEMPPRGPDK